MSNATDSNYQLPKVFEEGTWLQGAIATGVLYGVVIVLYTMCARSLWRRIHSGDRAQKKHWFFFLYVNFIFVLSTIYVLGVAQIIQFGFINHRDYPGGPSAYEINTASALINVPFVVANWCTDALMIWRCMVVYKDSKLLAFVTALGGLLLLASIVTGSLWVIIVSRPAQSGSSWMSFDLLFPYIIVSLAINVIICMLTVFRLLWYRARISKVLGPGYGVFYASFATVLIESATLYAGSSLLYLIPYALGNPLANAFMQILGEAQVVAPLLIIHHVSEGNAWTKDTATRITTSTSHAMHRLNTPHTPQPARLLNVRVDIKGQHSEHDNAIKSVEERSNTSTV